MNELSAALQTRQKDTKKEIIKREHLDFSQEAFNENELEINEFLKLKAYELITINSKATLTLGKIFTEIFEKLGNNRVGTYEKFIKELGYNVRTVQRYRMRFELYSKVQNENSKSLIALLPVKYLEKLMGERERVLPLLESGITKEELIKSLDTDKPLIEDRNEEITISSEIFKNLLLDLSLKAEAKEKKLTDREKLKLKKLLEQIESILNK